MSKRVLVTGGAGFIPSNFIRHLLAKTPYEVVSLDALDVRGQHREPRGRHVARAALVRAGRHPRRELVRDVVQNVDVIVNAAAESHVEKSIRDGASEFVRTNVEGTQILLDAIRETPVERFILISSSEVYGTAVSAPMDESHPLEAAQPVRGDEGRRRPARVLVLRHVRIADRDRAAVQQLRAAAASGEGDSALHHAGAAGRAADRARRRSRDRATGCTSTTTPRRSRR